MKVAIVGGSLGGLSAGLALRELANRFPSVISTVEVFEKSPQRLSDGGAGIVLQPEVAETLRRYTNEGINGVEVNLQRRQFAQLDGKVKSLHMPQAMTSWEAIWKRLRKDFPDDHYHSNIQVTGVEELDDGRIKLVYKNTGKKDFSPIFDLVVAADGAGSRIRQQFFPGLEPSFAGYVAYRGTLTVADAPAEIASFFNNSFSVYNYPSSRQHILVYLIPGIGGDTTTANNLRINWVWYRNKSFEDVMRDKDGLLKKFSVPAGQMSMQSKQEMTQAASRLLPPQFAALVHATDEPYIQAIHDMSSQRMVVGKAGRVLLMGDAAGLVRPHTASGTSKAAGDALDLADILEEAALHVQSSDMGRQLGPNDLADSLMKWEEGRLRHIRSLELRGRMIGDQYGYEEPDP